MANQCQHCGSQDLVFNEEETKEYCGNCGEQQEE